MRPLIPVAFGLPRARASKFSFDQPFDRGDLEKVGRICPLNWFTFLIEPCKKLDIAVLEDREEFIEYIVDYCKNLYLKSGIG